MLIHEDVPLYESWLKPFISGFIMFTLMLGLIFLLFNTELAITMFAISAFDVLLFWIIIPRGFQIYEDRLRIQLGWPFAMSILLRNIDKARPGSSGDLWFYWGFRFGTSTSSIVEIIRNKGMNILISPDNSERFIDQLNQAIERQSTLASA